MNGFFHTTDGFYKFCEIYVIIASYNDNTCPGLKGMLTLIDPGGEMRFVRLSRPRMMSVSLTDRGPEKYGHG